MLLIFLNACNTVTGTVEGTGRGIIKDVKTFHHYSTCIFTDTQCGDLDLKKWFNYDQSMFKTNLSINQPNEEIITQNICNVVLQTIICDV